MNSGIINKEIVEFEVIDKLHAFEIRQELTELASTKIPLIVDEVLSRYFGKDDLVRIDKMEIDLGTLGFDNFNEEFTECFHNQFEEEIIKYIAGRDDHNLPVEKASSSESDFELLTFFINTGSLPWWVINKQDLIIDELLDRVIKLDKDRFLKFLTVIAFDKSSISRIVNQFSLSSIHSLNFLLKESHNSFIHFYRFINIFFEKYLKQLLTKPAFERNLFEFLIPNLLRERKVESRTEFLIIDFIELFAVSNLLNVTQIQNLFKNVISLEPFGSKSVTTEIKKLFNEYFTHENYEVRRDLFLFIEQVKDLISGKTYKDKIQEDFKQSEVFEKENSPVLAANEVKAITSEQKEKLSVQEKVDETKISGDEKSFSVKAKADDLAYKKIMETGDEPLQKVNEDISKLGTKKKIHKSVDEKLKHKKLGQEEKLEEWIARKMTGGERTRYAPQKEEEYLQMQKVRQTEPLKIYIENSGLILVSAFLPAFFGNLDLIENDKFKNTKAIERGVHILQYLVNEKTKSPEYVLALNKILCGLDLNYPVAKSIKITKREKEESIKLLQSVIKNWSVLKNTSVEGFRNSFLIRNGIITEEENQYNLKVELKSYDVLLDHLPWSISIIKHNWMNKPVYVEWSKT